MILNIFFRRHRTWVILHDILMIAVAWFGAYWLRYNLGNVDEQTLRQAVLLLPIVMLIHMVLASRLGLYRGVWRYASMPDLLRIIKSSFLAAGAFFVLFSLIFQLKAVPRSVYLLYGILTMVCWGGSRFLYRWLKDSHSFFREAKRVLIIGAGRAGEGLVRDLLRQPQGHLRPVAFLDDNARRRGQEIHGIRVLGKTEEVGYFVKQLNIQLIIIAIPSITSGEMRRIVNACESTKVPYRTLPSLKALAEGRLSINALRAVSIEDLLGRDVVHLDWAPIVKSIENKVVLVTGGGGSIGSELCRQISQLKPKQMIIVDHSEFNLYQIHYELSQQYPEVNCVFDLANIADAEVMNHLFSTYHPEIIFHAAAYKHVPLLQPQVLAAVKNNVLGTRLVADLAHHYKAERFVLVSTDKVVNPTSILGVTKRLAEIYCQNLNEQSPTRYITVRFGNVLDSAGSVVPLFKKQLEAGGPLTVTHPEMVRYFMTIKEAVSLILKASSMGNGGEIFVLDMGEPVKIQYLAEQMIQLAGQKIEEIGIEYIGLREGEKLFEELFYADEHLQPTEQAKISLAHSKKMPWKEVITAFSDVEKAYHAFDETQLEEYLYQLVPEYQQHKKNVKNRKMEVTEVTI